MSRLAIASLLLALALAGCGPERRGAATVKFEECRIPKLSTAARCATIDVPENRDAAGGRRIGLFVAVLPANTLSPEPDPLLVLPGGPGQSATALATFASRLVEVRRTRDVLLIDPRGTGRSAPLTCEGFKVESPAESLEIDPLPRARRCLDELRARGVDVTQYTTAAWVADLEDVRKALGIARWNLWGGSYGSRVALEYVRRFPQQVRSMILDGVAPPSLRVTSGVWQTRQRAMTSLIEACEANAGCRAAHPDLRGALDALRAKLGNGLDVAVTDPRTGRHEQVRMTFEAALAALQPLAYVPELAAMIPEILRRALDGDYAPLFATALLVIGELDEQMNTALHLAVTCTEDAPRVTEEDRKALDALPSRALSRNMLAVCDLWPKGPMPAELGTPVTSDVPTLLLSGALDPVTPPAYADEVAKTLRTSRHLVAGGYGHIVSPHACGPRIVASFVERAGFDKLSQSCIDYFAKSMRPPLWRDHLAPGT